MNRFERLRFEHGMTQREVSEGSGVSLSTVIRLERGARKAGAGTAKALADFYGISVAELLDSDTEATAA